MAASGFGTEPEFVKDIDGLDSYVEAWEIKAESAGHSLDETKDMVVPSTTELDATGTEWALDLLRVCLCT